MNAAQIITAKRDGKELDERDIRFLIEGYTAGTVDDGQMAAFAMAVYFRGMKHQEIAALTRAMLESGTVMLWNDPRPMVDKHSTGGIGDKISIPLAPILVECGMKVPMISGRGLGTTGGTIDKLESIPGYRTDLSLAEIERVVGEVGCTITAATGDIAPADKRFYALRDVTGTVPSVPLITASILSKKLAEGLDALVLDVKWGNGAFMKTLPEAESLAKSLVLTATELGMKTHAILTDMNRPLGKMIGNAVEVDESIEVLQGGGPNDVIALTERLAVELMMMCGLAPSEQHAVGVVRQAIASGAAMRRLQQMVRAQGGDLELPRPRAPRHEIISDHAGTVAEINSDRLGLAVIEMGGGRKNVGQSIDHSVGIEMQVDIGDDVQPGQPLATIFCHETHLAEAAALIKGAIRCSDEPVSFPALIGRTITMKNVDD